MDVEFPGMIPCVIAGPNNEAENFLNYFLKSEAPQLIYPYYQNVNSLTILYSTDGRNGNRLTVKDFDEDTVNDQSNNLDNGGLLFTPDGHHICFFPTGGTDEDGIEEDWLTGKEI